MEFSPSESTSTARGGRSSFNVRAQFEQMLFRVQNEVCAAVEALDGGKFCEGAWLGDGGRSFTCVLQNGTVWEKAGVNVSVLSGMMPHRVAIETTDTANNTGHIPFYAAAISSVMYPRNPFAPSVHFCYQYFETEGVEGAPSTWWFGGGTDLIPSYIFEEDVKHFHQHRGQRPGVGGIFFDNLNDRDPEELLALATACADTVIPAYIPIVEKRKDTPFSDHHTRWQQLRRGFYVEFILVHGRGMASGMRIAIENMLMILPLTARWEFDHHPAENSDEWKLLEACKNPRTWV